jgi:hypothetical protein
MTMPTLWASSPEPGHLVGAGLDELLHAGQAELLDDGVLLLVRKALDPLHDGLEGRVGVGEALDLLLREAQGEEGSLALLQALLRLAKVRREGLERLVRAPLLAAGQTHRIAVLLQGVRRDVQPVGRVVDVVGELRGLARAREGGHGRTNARRGDQSGRAQGLERRAEQTDPGSA